MQTPLAITPWVIGKVFRQLKFAYNTNKKEPTMLTSIKQFLIVTVVAIFMLGTASASAQQYTRVLPNGLSTNSAAAKKQVQSLVSNDAAVQSLIAEDHGVTVAEVENAKVVKISRTRVTIGKDEENTARVASTGAIVPTSYMHGQTVAAWKVTLKFSAEKTIVVKWKRDCSNPFKKKGASYPPLRITQKTTKFTMPFQKTKTTIKVVPCPSGPVTVKVVSTVKGKVKVRSVTKGAKLISQKLTAQITGDVKNAITVVCAAPPPPTQSPEVTIICANNSCNPVCGNNSVQNGDGNTSNQGGNNCPKEEPPPPPEQCPPGTTGTPPNCVTPPPPDHKPQVSCVWPAHVFVGGNVAIWCEASDADGDAITLNVVGDSYGHVSGTIPVDVRWDNTPCPSGVKCFRSTFWGDQVGTSQVLAWATAKGVDSEPAVGYIPVKPEPDGGF